MALQPGNSLGPYEILAAIGAGGMGEVYRARDAKLGRDVALKALPEAFARDAERMARFQREAKALASLNHSNIASIYGLEDSGSTHALVMELVEGPTLADRIKAGPIPVDEAVLIARQIAEGLEYAHERGIVPSVERGKSNIADCPCIPPQGSSASHGRKANPRTPCTYSPASARDLPEGLRSENLHENLISHP